jgi:hypothetical protein
VSGRVRRPAECSAHRPTARSCPVSAEAGFVAGLEALAFGVLVFVVGTLILVNGWAVVDAKFATNAAAREAVRAVVETPGGGSLTNLQLQQIALSAARQAGAAHGYASDAVSITPRTASGGLSQDRCGSVRIEANVDVRPTILPGFVGRGAFRVSSIHEEVIDPFRSGLKARDDLDRLAGNPCGF